MALFQSRPSELATELRGLYLSTDANTNCTEATTEQRFADLQKIRKSLTPMYLEIIKEKKDPAQYDPNKLIDRLEQLREVYRTGEYWYLSPEGLVKKKKVTEPSPKDVYYLTASIMTVAERNSKDFTCEGTLSDAIKRRLPAYALERGRGELAYPSKMPTRIPWHLKRRMKKIYRPAEEFALKAFETCLDLCCMGYGYGAENAAMHAETAAEVLQELDALRPRWKKVRSHEHYVKMAAKHGITL